MTDLRWRPARLDHNPKSMQSYPYHDPPRGLSGQLIIDTSPLPRPPTPILWSLSQIDTDTPLYKIYRVLDPLTREDTREIGSHAILFNTVTKSRTNILIQDVHSMMNEDGSRGIGFKLTFTYVVPSSSGGGKPLYFKTKSTRKSSRRKYFKRKSSKRRIRTKSKYRRQ